MRGNLALNMFALDSRHSKSQPSFLDAYSGHFGLVQPEYSTGAHLFIRDSFLILSESGLLFPWSRRKAGNRE